MCNVAEHTTHNTQHTTNTNYNKHNFCDVPRSVKIKHHPLSVRGDQGSSVVIHGQSVAIRYHPMSVREDQPSSFVSLHQGMRLPDKQTRYRQADKQDNKEDHKVSGFGCSEALSRVLLVVNLSMYRNVFTKRWHMMILTYLIHH